MSRRDPLKEAQDAAHDRALRFRHWMSCEECESNDVELVCFVGKDGKVYFKVECNAHGGFSHMVPRGEVHAAVEKMLERRDAFKGKL